MNTLPRVGLHQQIFFLTENRDKIITVSLEPDSSVFDPYRGPPAPFQVCITVGKTKGAYVVYTIAAWKAVKKSMKQMSEWVNGNLQDPPESVVIQPKYKIEFSKWNDIPVIVLRDTESYAKIYLGETSITAMHEMLSMLENIIYSYDLSVDEVNKMYLDYIQDIQNVLMLQCKGCKDQIWDHTCRNESEIIKVIDSVGKAWVTKPFHAEDEMLTQRLRCELNITCKAYTVLLLAKRSFP